MTTADPSPPKIDRPAPAPRSRYRRFVPLATRWTDNDAYGHLNNVVYLSLFDSAINAELVAAGVLDIKHSDVIGLVVENGCHFFSSLAFPQALEAGLAVARIGRTSVSYEIGIFAAGAAETAAHGRFIHVYVDRETRRPVPLPDRLLAFVKALQ
ncbi:MAG TPA: thioesterase family protein [Caldimonas sp.]|nr:thioesterase family protein [Caldimonas sp.]